MLQIHPGELELCNGIDDDCDGQVDEGLSLTYYKDVDNDGYGDDANPIEACTRPDGYVDNDKDCNDANASIHPGGKEICNGIDDNCDRIVNEGLNKIFYKDSDNDGFGDHAKPVEACSNPDGYVDNDKDCNDATPAIYPGAKEICNGIDEDCNGLIDEEFADFAGDRIPDCIDTDDDNDGVPDLSDCDPLDKKKDKVLICHKGNNICVSQVAVASHLKHGDIQGACLTNPITSTNNKRKEVSNNPAEYKGFVELPGRYSLSNYPNPFAGTTTIRYELQFDSKVSIKVFDMLGRLVQTLIDADKKAGTYTINFQQRIAGSSALFYRLVATSNEQHFEQTNKMILLK
ncbi:MAG: MopE-related protein [Ferruginibacter sp.]|nr:MopE-related protein [Ferruginibacter sp.]